MKINKSATFWLSETPSIPSKGWDAALNRICTYALFENVMTKKKFYVLNTHFDHVGIEAKAQSAKLIIEKIEEINNKMLPVFLMGDLNLEPDKEPILFLKNELNDSKEISILPPFGPSGTFNNFDFDKPVTRRIDYIFVSKNNIIVNKYAVFSDNAELKYPSDHLPVYIEIDFKN